MSFSPLPPPIFVGESYNIWVVKMKTYLQSHDLWNVVQNDTEPPPLRANPTIAQIMQHNENCAKKYKAWDKLKEEFQWSNKTKQQQLINLRRDFENLRMKDSETIKQYADRIMATVNNIRLFGDEFSDQRVVEKVITILPKKYESNISSLEDSRDLSVIPLTELINVLYAQKPEAEKAKARAQITKARSLGQRRKKKRRRKLPRRSFHLVLIARRPLTLKILLVQAAVDVKGQEEHVFTASCFASFSKVSKIWLINSRCTDHMASDESMFNELDIAFVSKVRIGNGELLMAKGNGKVVIASKLGNKTISEVLYVPNIDQNLLSVGQLLEKGYSLFFEGKTCMIKDATDQVLIIVDMHDRTFIVDVNPAASKGTYSSSYGSKLVA
ncbi:uncharacterized protein LOC105787094 [Gossypium raimondii]|uniref:uncharacterized protein LOC105787094 n=1 Tax=Gossypium raimondii TaxID=29730 RepID=UPI00063AA9CF|nr:uncharacterized protein LOC105787094 [Gossypium raimondii]